MRPGILAGAVAIAALAAACQPPVADLTESDRAALQQVVDDVTSTLLAADHDTWTGLFAEDAVVYAPNAPAVKGREALRSFVAAFPPIEDLEFFDVEIWGQADYAYAMSGYRYSVEGGTPDSGKQLWVFHRVEGSTWEITILSYSSDLPLPD